MLRNILAFTVFLFLLSTVAAQVALPEWRWDKYVGTSHWTVTVTEDERGCGGSVYDTEYSVSIEHNLTNAELGAMLHGPAKGTFISGNILHMPAKPVDENPGTSQLSAYDLFFTTDCTIFTGKYTWDYRGPYQSCRGTTTLNGVNSEGCPELAPVIPDVTPSSEEILVSEMGAARKDLDRELYLRDLRDRQENFLFEYDHPGKMAGDPLINQEKQWIADETQEIKTLEPKTESKYDAILDKSPDNFWANWDMAQLKKGQGKYGEFSNYLNTALNNKNIAEKTREEVKKDVAAKNGMYEIPAPDNSQVIKRLSYDADAIQNAYGIDAKKKTEQSDAQQNLKLFSIFTNGQDAINDVALN